MTQEEMDNIIAINRGGGDPVMFLSCGVPMGQSLQEKINQYWEILGNKYGFKPMTVEGSAKGKLFFLAEPKPIVIPKTVEEIAIESCSLKLPVCKTKEAEIIAEEINTKFAAFKKWADGRIETI